MHKTEKSKLSEMGFMEIDEFVEKRIIGECMEQDEKHTYERILCLNQYFDASTYFHEPGGDGYKLVLNCLQKYLDFKFIRENNCFRFDEKLFDERVSIVSSDSNDGFEYAVNDNAADYHSRLDGSKADIYYLLNEAEQTDIASRRCFSYVNSNRLHLTAVLVQLIERIVDNLENDAMKKHREYGRVLRTAFMIPEYAECDVQELFSILGCSKKQYYRLRNAGISLLSETLFGIFAGENGFANLYIRDHEIKIPAN